MSTDGGLILLYHRVVDLSFDPQCLCVSPERFKQHVDVLQARCTTMPITQMLGAARVSDLPERAVAITFDDGYADNLDHAAAILTECHMPATVFVTLDTAPTPPELWWDGLERVCFEKATLPTTLCLVVDGGVFRRDLSDDGGYDTQQNGTGWTVLSTDRDGPRQALYRSLFDVLKPMEEAIRRRWMEELFAWASIESEPRRTHRRLGREEISRLGSDGLIEIGAHTVTHPVLSQLRIEQQRAEIGDAKTRLEKVIGRPVTGFSYPYGTRRDYSAETVDLVRGAGFAYACSNFVGKVRAGGDPYQLPRVIVRDWDSDTFSRQLDEWWNLER